MGQGPALRRRDDNVPVGKIARWIWLRPLLNYKKYGLTGGQAVGEIIVWQEYQL